jgi:segregation and condensation protein A
MAATLAHIKSKMLLPAPPPGQEDEAASGEEEDPREALIRRLLEYQKYKQASADLVARGIAGSDVFLRGMNLEEAVQTGLPPLAQVPLFSLVEAFQGVLERSKVKLSHDIVHERMTLTDRINELVDVLRVKKRVSFDELFEGQTTRFDLVITFLALLEMTKLRMTRLFQEHPLAPIFIEFAAQVTGDAGEPVESEASETIESGEASEAAKAAAAAADAGEEPTMALPPADASVLEAAEREAALEAGLEVRSDGTFASVPPGPTEPTEVNAADEPTDDAVPAAEDDREQT